MKPAGFSTTKDKIGQATYKKIAKALKRGESRTEVQKQFGVSREIVNKVADNIEYDSVAVSLTRSRLAATQFNKARRLEALNKFFEKAEFLLAKCDDAESFRHLAYALSLLIDKRRLEEGSSTGRLELGVGVFNLSKLSNEKLEMFEKLGREAIAESAPLALTDGERTDVQILEPGDDPWTKQPSNS